jgi:hypothetical protein
MSDYGTTWEDIEPTPQLEKNPTRNALDRFTTDPTDTQEKEYVERVAVFMSEDMLKTIIEDYDYWARQLSHGDTLDSIRRGRDYQVIADNLREYVE